ncbi:MAG: GNAT family N-acetyltransferase, partial [Myxococcota bacterium]
MSAPRAARREDLPAVRALLGRAFADDPFVGWLTGGSARRRRAYVRLVLDALAWRRGHVDLREGPAGPLAAALWMPPGTWRLSGPDQLRLLPAVIRSVGLTRLGAAAEASERVERA